ncbi:MAG: orotate phosphoribosyltransferase [Alphaproteobacteria bacterium]|nr:orotate phosphoribosyltransferase [Alphaproteobacteria bacterium]
MTTLAEASALVARALIDVGAVGVRADNPITFKSGIVSPVYVDNRTLPFHPVEWKPVIEGFKTLIDEKQIAFDVLAGVAVGGVPHASALGYMIQKPSLFIRKEAKEHGTGKRVEGGKIEGKNVLLIEDLVTTGGSSLSAVNALREEGGTVTTIASIVTYGFAEAKEAFDKAAITAHALTDFHTIMKEGVAMGRFTQEEQAAVTDWLADPHGWGAKRKGTA